jgi:NAD-dependent SIR2 family protein deacetylase
MVRKAIEQVIFNVIRDSLVDGIPPLHSNLLEGIRQKTGKLPTVITLNYDVIVDNSLMKLVAHNGQFRQLPGYGTQVYPWSKRGVKLNVKEANNKLLKLHGSLNWLYCPGCQRLNVAVSESLKSTFKQMAASSFKGRFVDDYYMSTSKMSPYQNDQTRCIECDSGLKSVMITPTHLKDYRNPHISNVWYNAERALKKANKVFIIGYSLPEDDVEVIYLLKRGLSHLSSEKITVVEYSKREVSMQNHEVGRRYRSLFGENLVWSTKGFEELVENLPNYLN